MQPETRSQPSSITCFQAHGCLVVAGDADKKVTLWDLRGKKPLNVLRGHGAPITAVAFNEFRVLSGDSSGKLIVWDIANPLSLLSSLCPS